VPSADTPPCALLFYRRGESCLAVEPFRISWPRPHHVAHRTRRTGAASRFVPCSGASPTSAFQRLFTPTLADATLVLVAESESFCQRACPESPGVPIPVRCASTLTLCHPHPHRLHAAVCCRGRSGWRVVRLSRPKAWQGNFHPCAVRFPSHRLATRPPLPRFFRGIQAAKSSRRQPPAPCPVRRWVICSRRRGWKRKLNAINS